MTLEKAIEILTFFSGTRTVHHFNNLLEAIQLGIEALKLEQHRRVIWEERGSELLPGETKD